MNTILIILGIHLAIGIGMLAVFIITFDDEIWDSRNYVLCIMMIFLGSFMLIIGMILPVLESKLFKKISQFIINVESLVVEEVLKC